MDAEPVREPGNSAVDQLLEHGKAVKEMLEMKVNASHVEQATKQLMSATVKGKKLTVTDLYSVAKTAESIAATPVEKKPKKFTVIGEEEEQLE